MLSSGIDGEPDDGKLSRPVRGGDIHSKIFCFDACLPILLSYTHKFSHQRSGRLKNNRITWLTVCCTLRNSAVFFFSQATHSIFLVSSSSVFFLGFGR